MEKSLNIIEVVQRSDKAVKWGEYSAVVVDLVFGYVRFYKVTDEKYTVTITDTSVTCTCKGYKYRHDCKHARAAKALVCRVEEDYTFYVIHPARVA